MPSVPRFEDGQIPMGIRLPKALYGELHARSIASGVPLAEQFRRALRFWFDKNPIAGTKPRQHLVSLKPSKGGTTTKRKKR